MILTHTYISVRVVNCTPLTYDDVACLNYLTAEFLESEALAL